METNIANMNGKSEDNVDQITIPRHIVVSGGGPSLFTIFGAVKCLVDKELIDPGLVRSIHACSSGAFIGLFLCVAKLGMSFEELAHILQHGVGILCLQMKFLILGQCLMQKVCLIALSSRRQFHSIIDCRVDSNNHIS